MNDNFSDGSGCKTLGPGGKQLICLESDHVGIPDRLSKDGISVFMSMAHQIRRYKTYPLSKSPEIVLLGRPMRLGMEPPTAAVLANE